MAGLEGILQKLLKDEMELLECFENTVSVLMNLAGRLVHDGLSDQFYSHSGQNFHLLGGIFSLAIIILDRCTF